MQNINEHVSLLAIAYAEALVKYHESRLHNQGSSLREDQFAFNRAEDQFAFNRARDAMYDAQNQLDAAARAYASWRTGVPE